MKLSSAVFSHQGTIPARYTCDGENINPPLFIADVPDTAQSLVLIMDDPDVPESVRTDRMWDHWVLYNIPPETRDIAEDSIPAGAVVGINTSGKPSYGGPCPPDREHRYFFKVYALKAMLDLSAGAAKSEVEKAMNGHVIAEAQLMGRYEREK